MKENYYLDDGTYSASQIVIELVRRRLAGEGDIAGDLLSQLKEPLESKEFRLKLHVSIPWKAKFSLSSVRAQSIIAVLFLCVAPAPVLFKWCTVLLLTSLSPPELY